MTVNTNILFQNYFSDVKNYDEVLNKNMIINSNWENLLENLTNIGSHQLKLKQNEVNWLMTENGVTYNVYNDPKGLNRPWNLNIVPFLIHENEWTNIKKGIEQRAELFNLVLKDIYGKRELISKGIVPYEVIFAHRGFLRQCDQIQYKTSKHLLIYSADLARGPDGRMWVVNDRTQAPSGMGYALENRYSISRVFPDIFKNMNVKQAAGFFYDFNQMLVESAPQNQQDPNIIILTPGPHNETYFEHAYLSTFLGYPLVHGNDLVVRNKKVYIKSLKGLKQVDVILRRVDDAYMDPLELREDSYLGIVGLLDVVREQNVTVVNPIGSGILENSGLIPFMNHICRFFLNEDLILPQIASWWCGQEKERNFVLNNLTQLVVKRIDRSHREYIYFCEFLTHSKLEELKKAIQSNPYSYVAQEKISFSTAPDFVNGQLEPRKVTCRTFAIAKQSTIQNYTWDKSFRVSISDINDLPSQTAENLFWSGRYLGRALVTARFLRMALNRMNDLQFNEQQTESDNLQYIYQAITNITSTFPGFVGKGKEITLKNPLKEICALILDEKRYGTFAQALNSFNNSYYSLRNLWSKDMWRVFDSIQKTWHKFKEDNNYSISELIKLLDKIITRLIAFMGLIEESIMVEQGLLLYFIGLQTEQAMMNIEKCRALLVFNHEEHLQYQILESLLISHESLNIYRYSYRSYLSVENVIKLILLDEKFPKSLTYQLNRIQKDIDNLPHSNTQDLLSEPQKYIYKAHKIISETNVKSLLELNKDGSLRQNLDEVLSVLSDLLHETSLSISNTYFNHSQQQTQLVNQDFTS